MLAFSSITPESFSAMLNEMLTNKVYSTRAKELARTFNDNLVHPMDEAMFWIEYVIRSKGAKHLKSNAVNIPLFSYLLLDVLLLPIAILVITCLVARKLFQIIKSNGKQKKNVASKKMKKK